MKVEAESRFILFPGSETYDLSIFSGYIKIANN